MPVGGKLQLRATLELQLLLLDCAYPGRRCECRSGRWRPAR